MNSGQEHPSRRELANFLWGRLSDADQAALARHIERCDVCCETMREIPDDPVVEKFRDAGLPASGDSEESASAWSRADPLPKELTEHPRYAIGRFLGSGGMGVVYQAEHRLMKRKVALKIIHRDLIRRARVVERFHQEVKAAASLSHPNIVTAYDAEQAGDAHFLVMEFIDGISLSQLVQQKGPLEIALACNFALQTAKGLQHAFEAGMVHRDIKPHNLMLTRKGQIKILDFGLARLASETAADHPLPASVQGEGLTRTGDVMGTPDFMAPEQIRDPRRADIRADLYSLGSTLYYLLSEETPYPRAANVAATALRAGSKPRSILEFRPDLPLGLVEILDTLLAQNPADRYATPAEVAKALMPFAKPTPVGPASPEVKAPPSPPIAANENTLGFQTECPFCATRIRVPHKAREASIACPSCRSYFTAVPTDG